MTIGRKGHKVNKRHKNEGFIAWLVIVLLAICLDPITIAGIILLATSFFAGASTVGAILLAFGVLGGLAFGTIFFLILDD